MRAMICIVLIQVKELSEEANEIIARVVEGRMDRNKEMKNRPTAKEMIKMTTTRNPHLNTKDSQVPYPTF